MDQKLLFLLVVAAASLFGGSCVGDIKRDLFSQGTDLLSDEQPKSTQALCVDGDVYAYFSEPQSFEDAKRICQKFHFVSVMATPRSNRHLEAFSTISAVSNMIKMWVGMSLNPNTLFSNPSDFMPLDEERLGVNGIEFFQNASVGESPWAAGEPNGTPENPQQCVSYDRETNALSDESCEELKPFVCVLPNFCLGSGGTCIGLDLYEFPESLSTFDESLKTCGGSLGEIRSEQDIQIFTDALKFSGNEFLDSLWTGIKAPNGNFGNPSKFVSADGTTAGLEFLQTEPGVVPWAPNEPDGGSIDAPEDCVVIDPVLGLLRDVSCEDKRLPICKVSNNNFCQQIDESLRAIDAPTLSPGRRTSEPVIAFLVFIGSFVASCL